MPSFSVTEKKCSSLDTSLKNLTALPCLKCCDLIYCPRDEAPTFIFSLFQCRACDSLRWCDDDIIFAPELGGTCARGAVSTGKNNNNPVCRAVHFACQKINRIHTHIYIFLRAAARDTVGGWEPSNFSPCCWHKNVPKSLRPCSGYLSRRGYCVEDGVMAGARWLTGALFTHWQQLFCNFVVSVIFWPTENN